jgi:hypothetical protein
MRDNLSEQGEPSSKAKYYKFSDSEEKYCEGKIGNNNSISSRNLKYNDGVPFA